MKCSQSNIDINQLLQAIPESTQQVISGGTFDVTDATNSAETSTIPVHGYIRIKKLNSGG